MTYLFGLRPGDGYSPRGSDNFEHGNNTESDGLQAPGTGTLNDYSYYLNDDPATVPPKPGFWDITNAIPTIGPPHDYAPAKRNPAYARWFSGDGKTLGPPSIATQPVSQTVNPGQPAAFTVEAYGTPAALYTWHKNGTTIPGATNSTLSITNTAGTDEGTYCVLVFDSGGSMRSADARLSVASEDKPGTSLIVE